VQEGELEKNTRDRTTGKRGPEERERGCSAENKPLTHMLLRSRKNGYEKKTLEVSASQSEKSVELFMTLGDLPTKTYKREAKRQRLSVGASN